MRVTPKRKRWFVLKDYFLFYYKNKNDPAPAGVIILEFFSVKIEQDDSGAKYILLKRNFDEFSTPVISYSILPRKQVIQLQTKLPVKCTIDRTVLTTAEASKETLEDWHAIISKRVLNNNTEMEGTALCVPISETSSQPVLADAMRKYLLLETNNSFLTVSNSKVRYLLELIIIYIFCCLLFLTHIVMNMMPWFL